MCADVPGVSAAASARRSVGISKRVGRRPEPFPYLAFWGHMLPNPFASRSKLCSGVTGCKESAGKARIMDTSRFVASSNTVCIPRYRIVSAFESY